jgi:hypothetical protein
LFLFIFLTMDHPLPSFAVYSPPLSCLHSRRISLEALERRIVATASLSSPGCSHMFISVGIFIDVLILVVDNCFWLLHSSIRFFSFLGNFICRKLKLLASYLCGMLWFLYHWPIVYALQVVIIIALDSTAINIFCTLHFEKPKIYVVLLAISLRLIKHHCIQMVFCQLWSPCVAVKGWIPLDALTCIYILLLFTWWNDNLIDLFSRIIYHAYCCFLLVSSCTKTRL